MWKKVSASALALSLAVGGYANVDHASAAKSPDVTRGEYVKTMIDAMGVELGTGKSVKFNDVPDSLKPYIEKALELKLITGKSATVFAPDEKLSREHAFIIATRAIDTNKTYSENLLNKFTDKNKIRTSNRNEIAKAVGLGFLNGYPDKTVKPANIVSKHEMNNILKRF